MKSVARIKIFMIVFIICSSQGFTQTIWNQNGTAIYTSASNSAGIGTMSPDFKLTVKGKIHAKELKLNLSIPVPDYVFEKKYKLMPLNELEDFITKNKHLPEIPPAKEIEQSGISLSEMSLKILKKTEEMTLYIINHEKRLNALLGDSQININN